MPVKLYDPFLRGASLTAVLPASPAAQPVPVPFRVRVRPARRYRSLSRWAPGPPLVEWSSQS